MNGSKYCFGILFAARAIMIFAVLLLIPGIVLTGGCLPDKDNTGGNGAEETSAAIPASIYISRIFPEAPDGGDHYPGEEIKISFYLKNTGGSSAENIKVELLADNFLK